MKAMPAVPPADLEIRVTTAIDAGKAGLHYVLHSPSGKLDFFNTAIRGGRIRCRPEEYQATLFKTLEKLHRGLGSDGSQLEPGEVGAELEALGQELYHDLFPAELKTAYRRFRRHAETVLVISDEPWIPWEIVKPYDDVDPDDIIDDDFLCCRFQLTRWLAGGRPPAGAIHVGQLAAIEAGSPPDFQPLPHATSEVRFVGGLAAPLVGVEDLSLHDATYRRAINLLRQHDLGLLHFVGHGEINTDQPNTSGFWLVDGRALRPRDLYGATRTRLRKNRPLVFLNACQVAQQGWSLTQLGGWAQCFVSACGCGAFIGPQWTVGDEQAHAFAKAFYEALERGETFGRAAREARRTLPPQAPGRLAYSIYGHPNGRLHLGAKKSIALSDEMPSAETPSDETFGTSAVYGDRNEEISQRLSAGVQTAPDDEAARFNKAVACFLLEDYAQAKAILSGVVQRGGDPRYLMNLGYLLYLEGDYPEALKLFRLFIERYPYVVEAQLNAFKTCLAMSDTEQARLYCDAAAKLAPERADVKKARAQLLLAQGDMRQFFQAMNAVPDSMVFARPSDKDLERIKQNASVLVGEGRVSVMLTIFPGAGLRTALLGFRDGSNNLPKPECRCQLLPMTVKGRESIEVEELVVEETEVGMVGFRINGLEKNQDDPRPVGFAIAEFRFPSLKGFPGSAHGGLMLVDWDRQLRLEPRKIHVRELRGEAEGDLVDLYHDLLHPAATFKSDTSKGPRVFLAYAREDQETAERLFRGLEQRGIDVWKDTKSMRVGERFEEKIDEIIDQADFAIVCLSTRSVAKKGFIQREFRRILEVEKYRPMGVPFALPIKLNECEVPKPFKAYHWREIGDDREEFLDRLAEDILIHSKSEANAQGAISLEKTATSSASPLDDVPPGTLPPPTQKSTLNSAWTRLGSIHLVFVGIMFLRNRSLPVVPGLKEFLQGDVAAFLAVLFGLPIFYLTLYVATEYCSTTKLPRPANRLSILRRVALRLPVAFHAKIRDQGRFENTYQVFFLCLFVVLPMVLQGLLYVRLMEADVWRQREIELFSSSLRESLTQYVPLGEAVLNDNFRVGSMDDREGVGKTINNITYFPFWEAWTLLLAEFLALGWSLRLLWKLGTAHEPSERSVTEY